MITAQLRTALILNKNVKAANFNIDTVNKKTYIFGIAPLRSSTGDILNLASVAAYSSEVIDYKKN